MLARQYWRTVTVDESDLLDGFLAVLRKHSVNASLAGSVLRIQIQTAPRYAAFIHDAIDRDMPGITLPMARMETPCRETCGAATPRAAARRVR